MTYDPKLAKEVDQGRLLFIRRETAEEVEFIVALRLPDRDVFCLDALAVLRRTYPHLRKLRERARVYMEDYSDLWDTVGKPEEDFTPEVAGRWNDAYTRLRRPLRGESSREFQE